LNKGELFKCVLLARFIATGTTIARTTTTTMGFGLPTILLILTFQKGNTGNIGIVSSCILAKFAGRGFLVL